MKLVDYLEEDREKLLLRLSSQEDTASCIPVLEDEINRIMIRRGEEQGDEIPAAGSPEAEAFLQSLLAALKAAMPLVDSMGEVKVYEVVASSSGTAFDAGRKKLSQGTLPWVIPAVAASFGPVLVSAWSGRRLSLWLLPVLLLFSAGSLVLAYMAGRRGQKAAGKASGPARSPQQGVPEAQKVVARPDADKIYHHLQVLLTVMDQKHQEALFAREQALLEAKNEIVLENASSAVPEEVVRLLAGVLESAYAQRKETAARQILADIRFYLHSCGVEVVDYSGKDAAFFDCMPSKAEDTVRPALVQGGVLLCRGLAVTAEE